MMGKAHWFLRRSDAVILHKAPEGIICSCHGSIMLPALNKSI